MGGSNTVAKKRRISKAGKYTGKNDLTPTQRLQIIKEVKEGKQMNKIAERFNVSKSYVSKLMKPETIAALEQNHDAEFNQDVFRVPKPVHEELESRLLAWIKIARARFAVRVAVDELVVRFLPQWCGGQGTFFGCTPPPPLLSHPSCCVV